MELGWCDGNNGRLRCVLLNEESNHRIEIILCLMSANRPTPVCACEPHGMRQMETTCWPEFERRSARAALPLLTIDHDRISNASRSCYYPVPIPHWQPHPLNSVLS